jgi:chloramphenicol-sensitive protein RarD
MSSSKVNSGYVYALLAYFCWGFFPIYWKFLKHVPLMQILAHRVLWAFVFYTLIICIKDKKISLFKPPTKKVFMWLITATVMLMCNWLLYIYAVNSNQVIESSLGYFINPIVNILFGVYFLKEKLSKPQIIATVCAVIGVSVIATDQGHIPVIALVLALTFSLYGLIKKINPLPSLQSNQFESFLFVAPALVFIFLDSQDWLTTDNRTSSVFLLVGSGLITGLPLLFFSEAAKKIPYYMMGFFQFLAPTLQFLCGVFLYNEPLSKTKIIGFSFIWTAALILAAVSYLRNRFIPQKH